MKIDDYVIAIRGVLQDLGALSDEDASHLETSDLDLAGVGLDSIKVVDFCLLLEQHIGREVTVDDLIMNPSIRKLATHFAENCK